MPADAPDLRPKTDATSAAPMETGPDHQIGHQFHGDLLAKVLPAGEPLVSTHWTCPQCGYSKRGAPPPACVADDPCCPIGGHP